MCRATFDASTSIRNLCEIEVLFLGVSLNNTRKKEMRTSNDDDGFQQVWTLHMGQVTFCTVPRPNFHSTVRNHTVVCVAGRGRRWSLRLRNRTGEITEDGQGPRYFGRTLHMSESSTTKQMTRIRGGMCVYLLFFAITVRMTLQGSVLLLHPSL